MEKSKVIEKLFQYIDAFSYLLLPLIFLFYKNKKKDGMLLAIYGLLFFILIFSFDYFTIYLRNAYGDAYLRKYVKLYNTFYTFSEYFFFALLFYYNIQSTKFKRTIQLLSLTFFLFLIAHYFWVNDARIDSIAIGIESILIFIYIFLFFLESLSVAKEGYIYAHHCFWISVGLLIYLGGSFFINILANTLPREELDKYWSLNFIADTIKTLFFAVALIVYIKRSGKTTDHKPESVPHLDII